MLHTNARFSDAVESAVTDVESRTDAEVIVVAAPRSGRYLDVAVLFGCGVAWLLLLAVLFSPWAFRPAFIPLELPVVGAAAAWLANRSPALLRLLTRRARRQRQVREAADAAFHQELVHGTRNRTGLLIYVSALEDRVLVLTDVGLDARVPRAEWNSLAWGPGSNPHRPHDLDHFLAGLKSAGDILARHVPALDDNPDEIANAPRIRT